MGVGCGGGGEGRGRGVEDEAFAYTVEPSRLIFATLLANSADDTLVSIGECLALNVKSCFLGMKIIKNISMSSASFIRGISIVYQRH